MIIMYQVNNLFPSPYGVSFILIGIKRVDTNDIFEFPSPYGVSFILMKRHLKNSFK